ncbi:hypothetical protein [Nitrosopumilus sp.]|uniref:hypothetical protein n=1 Tax=Nitrosopumilus sp. TaxID=2024843 RepID=UPI0034A03D1B
MTSELEDAINDLKKVDEKINDVSKQWVVLKHKYRSNKDPTFRADIKKKWNRLQKKLEILEKKRRKIIEKKNEIEFKDRWKGWK